MKKTVLIVYLCCWVLCPEVSFSAPAISGTTGAFNHNAVVTVSGSGFGTKSPVAPILWDNGSGRTAGQAPSAGGWSGWHPSSLTGGDSGYNMQYRTAGSFRSVAGPHSRNSLYLAGAGPGYEGYGGADGINPMVWYEWNVSGTANIFASVYWRLDPNGMTSFAAWPELNVKNFQFCAGGGVCTGASELLLTTAYAWGAWYTYDPFRCGGSNWCSDTGTNPSQNWVKTDIIVQANTVSGQAWLYDNGVEGVAATGDTSSGYSGDQGFGFGGYWQARDSGNNPPAEPFVNNYRYLADLYFDTTWARVEICHGSTWSTRGICEMQIPTTTWGNTSLQITVNAASFSDGQTGYLYVIDNTNVANNSGAAVTFGAGESDTTAPTVTSASVNGTTVTVGWDETIVSTGYDAGDFNLDCTTAGTNISLSAPSGSGATRTFTSATAVGYGDTCNLDYVGSTNDIEDVAGNDMAAVNDIAVTNNTPAPTSVSYSGCIISGGRVSR